MTHRRRILSVRTLRIRNKTHFKMFCMLTQLLRDRSFPLLEFKKKNLARESPKRRGHSVVLSHILFFWLIIQPAMQINCKGKKKKVCECLIYDRMRTRVFVHNMCNNNDPVLNCSSGCHICSLKMITK